MANDDVVENDLSTEVTRFLDEVVGKEKSSAAKVHSVLQDALNRKKLLEKELSEAQCRTPDKIQGVLDRGCSAVKEIKTLQEQQEKLTSKVDNHLQKLQPLAGRLSALVSQIAEVERFRAYVSWIQKIQSVSCQIQQFLEAGQLSWAVEEFSVLTELAHLLVDSACCNLTKFVKEMQIHWHKILLNKLASEFDETSKALKWPFTSLSTAPPLSTTSDVFSRLENVFILLLKLQDFKNISSETSSSSGNECEILLPLDWLLKPLRKRFRFHFYGNKQTNNLEKPEWYFTQVLNWIKNHSDFLQHTIQPILQKTQFGAVDAKTEFIRGLLVVVVEKMEHSIPQVIDDDMLFSHFVDEVLLFDKEIHTIHSYPSTDHGCLHVMTTTECLNRWVELERHYASSNMESILASQSAWTPKYKDVGDVDDTRTPECAEGFMTLLSVISDRYRNLPDISHQEGFVDVQLYLLDSFISRLTLEAEESSFAPASLHYCSVANAANYIVLILQEWSEQMLFLKLYEHRVPVTNSDDRESSTDKVSNDKEYNGDDMDLPLAGSVFGEAIIRLQDLKEHMISVIVQHVVQGFKMLSKPFKKDRWHSLPPPKDVILLMLSSSACEMLLFLKGRLQILQEQLSSSIFSVLWKDLACALNKLLYEEIILENHFNDGGAAQLQFDLTKNLFTLFLEYTQKPENFFKEVKEACILLNLLPGSAVLLMELLKSARCNTGEDDDSPSPRAALNDAGVYRLSAEDAFTVLNLRINWPSVC